MDCPQCGLLNPPTAQRCDCGYDFVRRPPPQKLPSKEPKPAWLIGTAAGLGFLQGLFNLVLGIVGGPPGFQAQDRLEATVAVILMILQGVAMLVFSVATYKRKRWGAYGLCAIALLFVAMSLYTKGSPGWIIPPLIYLGAAVSLHRAQAAYS